MEHGWRLGSPISRGFLPSSKPMRVKCQIFTLPFCNCESIAMQQ
jgi:hypothetical protein